MKLNARSRAHVDRAKKFGVAYELFNDIDVFEEQKWTCQSCGKITSLDLPSGHLDRATLGHIIAMSNGGDHTRANTETACWGCNSKQAHEIDKPTKAKTDRLRIKHAPPEERAAREARMAPKRKMQGAGFRGSRSFSGAIKWKPKKDQPS